MAEIKPLYVPDHDENGNPLPVQFQYGMPQRPLVLVTPKFNQQPQPKPTEK